MSPPSPPPPFPSPPVCARVQGCIHVCARINVYGTTRTISSCCVCDEDCIRLAVCAMRISSCCVCDEDFVFCCVCAMRTKLSSWYHCIGYKKNAFCLAVCAMRITFFLYPMQSDRDIVLVSDRDIVLISDAIGLHCLFTRCSRCCIQCCMCRMRQGGQDERHHSHTHTHAHTHTHTHTHTTPAPQGTQPHTHTPAARCAERQPTNTPRMPRAHTPPTAPIYVCMLVCIYTDR